ncbi:Gfo/Idh/MocA family protein [Falsibacillus pallidus]|uniref:Gfo/Idh/MocA family protein n=1 Tax=Falsibacillus pallidus TaxID=493781 RepID=UPI000E0A6200|nr:Gfo/Idh/MocA family oxidoreductase [Falsibacillus pallidus]
MKVGMMSFAHMHAFSYAECIEKIPNAELAAIYDDDPGRGEEAANRFDVPFVEDAQAFLELPLDAVIICSENARHKEMTIMAAKAKKHILCEKPLALTVDEAEEMIEVCKEEGVLLQTAFPVRFSQSMQKLKRMIDHGELGEIIAMRSVNRGQNPGGWFVDPKLAGGGAVFDHTVHMIDIMRWFLGKEIKEIYATVEHYFSEQEIDDAGLLTIEFEDGTIASHDTSWSRFSKFPAWGDAAIEVIGTKKSVKADAFGEKLFHYKNEAKSLQYSFLGNDIDQGLVEDFLQSVSNGTEPSITGFDGLKAVEAALAAYQSARESKPVLLREFS